MKKYSNKILLAIAAIVLICIAVEIPFMKKIYEKRAEAEAKYLRESLRDSLHVPTEKPETSK